MGCYAVAVFAYKRLWNTVVLPVILQQAVVGGVTVLQPLLRGILLPPVILQEAVVGEL
jgi:hypothetical protein